MSSVLSQPTPSLRIMCYTHTQSLSHTHGFSPEMVRSGARAAITRAHHWTPAQKKATFPPNEFAQGPC